MEKIIFYKNQNNSYHILEIKELKVLFFEFRDLNIYKFLNINDLNLFVTNKEKEIYKNGFKKISFSSLKIPNELNNYEEVIDCFNNILEKEALFSVFEFLKIIPKSCKTAFVKELKKYRKYLTEFGENGKSHWSRKGSDIQIEIVSLAALALMSKTDVMPWNEVFDLLKKSQFSYIENVLNYFKPTWLNSFILEKTLKLQWNAIDYEQLLYLEENKYIEFNQELFANAISNVNFWRNKTVFEKEFLFKNSITYQRDIPLLFEFPSNINNMTTSYIKDEVPKKSWHIVFQKLIEENKLDRFLVLQKCIDIQLKDWNNALLSFFRALFDELKPTTNELILLQSQLFLLLPISNKSIPIFAIKLIKKIALENDFNKEEFIEWTSVILSNFEAKTSIISVLQIFDKFLKKYPNLEQKILLKTSDVFVINDFEIQQRALSLILKYHKNPNEDLIENLKLYSNQMIISVAKDLEFLIGVQEDNSSNFEIDDNSNSIEIKKEEYQEIPLFKNWDDIFYAIGKVSSSENPIDFEIVLNAFLTQKELFPIDFPEKLKIYLKPIKENYLGTSAQFDHTILLNLILNNGAKKVNFDYSELGSNKIFQIRKHLIEYIFNHYNSNFKVSLLSFPTHFPFFINANTLVERILEYESKSIKINHYDLMIALNRMLRKFNEETYNLIDKLSTKNKNLFEILLEPDDEVAYRKANELLIEFNKVAQKNIFQKAFNFLSHQNSKIDNFINEKTLNHFEITEKSYFDCLIMVSRLRLPFEKFNALENTVYENVMYAISDCDAKLKFENVDFTYKDYDGKVKKEQKFDLNSNFKTSSYSNYFYYSYNIKNPSKNFNNYWDYFYNYDSSFVPYDINTYFGMMPFFTEPIFANLYNYGYRRSNYFSEVTSSIILKQMLQPHFKLGYFSNWFLACAQFADKKEVRLLSAEIVLHLIQYQKLDEVEFTKRILELHQNKYGTIQRYIENLNLLKDISSLHNKFLFKNIESLLIEFSKEDKVPTNTKKLLEILFDVRLKLNEKISESLRNSLEKWSRNSTLKKIIENILK